MRIFKRMILNYLKRRNPIKYARSLGVIIGENTTIAPTVSFSSEPYLIEIGNNVQVTDCVSFNTHGGTYYEKVLSRLRHVWQSENL